MTKTTSQLDAEIAEALRAKKWQEQVAREDQERRARIAPVGPSPTQLYDERASDFAAGIFHGEQRGRARELRRTPAQNLALRFALDLGSVNAGWNAGTAMTGRKAYVSANVLHALERSGLLKISRVGKNNELVGSLTAAGAIVARAMPR